MPSNMRRNRTRLPTWASTGLGFLPAIRSLAINIEIENWKMTHILDETILSSFIGGRFTPVKHGSAAPRICAGALGWSDETLHATGEPSRKSKRDGRDF